MGGEALCESTVEMGRSREGEGDESKGFCSLLQSLFMKTLDARDPSKLRAVILQALVELQII